jgi:hypothetical protein
VLTATTLTAVAPAATWQIPPDVQLYSLEVGEQAQRLGESLVALSALIANARPANEDWINMTAEHITQIQEVQQTLKVMTPPDGLRQHHQTLLDTSAQCSEATVYLINGIDNRQLADLEASSLLIQSCAEALRLTMQALAAYLQELP